MLKYFVWGIVVLLWTSGIFILGWIVGARVMSRQIADAIVTGDLSVQQRVEHIAEQIESGLYVSVTGRMRGQP